MSINVETLQDAIPLAAKGARVLMVFPSDRLTNLRLHRSELEAVGGLLVNRPPHICFKSGGLILFAFPGGADVCRAQEFDAGNLAAHLDPDFRDRIRPRPEFMEGRKQ